MQLQILTSNVSSPTRLQHETKIATMLPTLQPQRPNVPRPNRHFGSNPLYQQQARPDQTSSIHQQPRSQVEALSPFTHLLPSTQRAQSTCSVQQYDPATRHPVFFTERLRRAGTTPGYVVREGLSPVAEGYAWVDNAWEGLEREVGERGTKL